jgi:hypothetical protein
MKRLAEWFSDDGQCHQHTVKVTIHKLAVPGIDLCSLTLLWIARFVGHRIEGKRPSAFPRRPAISTDQPRLGAGQPLSSSGHSLLREANRRDHVIPPHAQ